MELSKDMVYMKHFLWSFCVLSDYCLKSEISKWLNLWRGGEAYICITAILCVVYSAYTWPCSCQSL